MFDFATQSKLDRVADLCMEVIEEQGGFKSYPPVEGHSPGHVNGRKIVGKIIREALRAQLVYCTEEQAEFLALSGSAGHTTTAEELLNPKDEDDRYKRAYEAAVEAVAKFRRDYVDGRRIEEPELTLFVDMSRARNITQ